MRKIWILLLTAALLLSMVACGQTAPEQSEPVTTEAPETTAAPETTEATEPAPIDTQEALAAALQTQRFVELEGDIALTQTVQAYGNELNGNGHTLTAPTYSEEDAATQTALSVAGGVIRDLKIIGGERALGDTRDNPAISDVRLQNVWIEATTNAINFGYGKTDGVLNAEGCSFYGWSSFKGFSSAYFDGCTFGKGNSNAKGNLRPYISTTMIDCHFESTTSASGKVQPYAILLRDNISGITITMENCYADGVLITEENVYELLEIKMYDNVLRICNTAD